MESVRVVLTYEPHIDHTAGLESENVTQTLCTDWITDTDVALCYGSTSGVDPTLLADSITNATELLYQSTGLQYPGECTATIRPCSAAGFAPYLWSWQYPWFAYRDGTNWVNVGPCGCNDSTDCGCNPYPKIDLGRRDIQTIDSVTINGAVLDPSAYRLDGHQWLVRQDGSGWPCCQDLGKPLGETGTWSAEVTYGNPVPQLLKTAAASLAAEYIKACNEEAGCRLPRRTQNVVKQGVSIVLLDDITSLPEVSAAVQAYNPDGLRTRPRVLSPDFGTAHYG